MAQFPGLTIWTDAWIADTLHLSWESRGIYFGLLVLMWRTPGCRVPNDDQWLAGHMGMTATDVTQKLRPLIAEFCQTDGNWVSQKRLKKEFVFRFEFGGRQKERAKKRWRVHAAKNADVGVSDKPLNNNKSDSHSGNAAPAMPPTPSYPTPPSKEASCSTASSFPTAATAEENNPARSFATAPCEGALAREPDSEPAERKRSPRKNPAEMTMAEFNAHWRGNGRYP